MVLLSSVSNALFSAMFNPLLGSANQQLFEKFNQINHYKTYG